MLIVPLLPILASTLGTPQAKTTQMQVVYLVEAENPPAMEKSAQERAQMEHLKNLEHLWTTRKAVLVGPLADGGRNKGIVLLDLSTPDDATKLMSADPWVKAGQLTPEVRSVRIPTNVLSKGPKFMDIEPHWFVQVLETTPGSRRAPTDHTKLFASHAAYLAKSLPQIEIRGGFESGDDHREFLILRGKDRGTIEKVFQQDPAVLAGLLKIEMNQLFISKGTFGGAVLRS